jgi:hypothetical protein
MRRRILALGAVLACLVAGCSSSHRVAATTTTSTVPGPNPDVVPAVITPAYVNAVFRVLEHVDGNASRSLIAAKAVTPAVLADIRAIYNDPLYQQEVKIAEQSVGQNLSDVRRPPGDVRVTVIDLISWSQQCIFVQTRDDYSQVLIHPGSSPSSGYWGLRRKTPGNDPRSLNPTPWALFFNAVYAAPTSIPDQCAV